MAKTVGSSSSAKVSLNKKSGRGKARKKYGPKDNVPKKYVGQGR
jgi:hypothetical protein